MDAREWTRHDPGPARSLGQSRSRVLDAVQDAGLPLAAGDVARLVGLHPNTTRFHLDGLVAAGLVERAVEDRDRPGRPRTLYTARPGAGGAGRRSYRLLAEILTSYLAAQMPQPGKAALQAGLVWGRYLAERPPPFQRVDVATATRHLVGTLDEIGFAPEAASAGPKRQILLRHCPFREAAQQHPDVVCSIHLGLMRGVLAELGAPLAAQRLDPFVEPGMCVAHLAHLARRDAGPAARPRRRG